ncbi:fimbrial protein [Burkholderia cepacia]|uniref:Type 1 fimbrial protein n=1 Tax=Burkholderia cepacia TaxID=292 RepID=A0A8I1ATB6_BURCE|nr:fimbrial protein [Burkholderia cepacia]KWF81380.1 fimbrial protein [Burkholderia cepacia]MBA9895472.1 type 1 fimbrial protein [Burkholderia cepacia]MBA9942007.1 type 1 fimbrial protein [Burkholderia cepacia]MBA9972264.1 type 1 fimbrial protein [Burkholderia cepacia]MBA9990836.1 type 1 fimbrial protein [Burkholderia cepacia]
MMTILRRANRWRQAGARLGAAALCVACVWYAEPAAAGATAVDCTFSNIKATSWKQVTRLTNSTPTGAVLYQRMVSLFVSYKYGPATSLEYELVSAGHWTPGTVVPDGAARTNVDGIGLRWSGVGGDGENRTLMQAVNPLAVAKTLVVKSGTNSDDALIAYFLQELVLTKAATGLPEGEIVVNDLLGTPSIVLYALALPKGTASLGSAVTIPAHPNPPNLCRQSITYTGVGNLTIGGGGGIPVPKQCEVESNMIVPVNLGRASLSQFPSLHAMSQPVDFKITLSRCAAAAKPTISFRDKAVQPNADKTLLQLSAPEGQALARGFNIVMTNGLSGERISYDEPDKAKQYPMTRIGDTAVMPLSAQYIRTGADSELRAGYAGGAAEFTFTFP